MKVLVYQQLFLINRGFDLVIRGLTNLKAVDDFDSSELIRFRTLVKEVRASTNSYLAAVIESAETDKAGLLFRKRLVRESKDEKGET